MQATREVTNIALPCPEFMECQYLVDPMNFFYRVILNNNIKYGGFPWDELKEKVLDAYESVNATLVSSQGNAISQQDIDAMKDNMKWGSGNSGNVYSLELDFASAHRDSTLVSHFNDVFSAWEKQLQQESSRDLLYMVMGLGIMMALVFMVIGCVFCRSDSQPKTNTHASRANFFNTQTSEQDEVDLESVSGYQATAFRSASAP